MSIDKSKIEHNAAGNDVGDTTFAELKMLQSKLANEYKNPSFMGRERILDRPTSGISN